MCDGQKNNNDNLKDENLFPVFPSFDIVQLLHKHRFLQEGPSQKNDNTTIDIVIYGATPAGLYAGLRLLDKIGNMNSQLMANLFPAKSHMIPNNPTNSSSTSNATEHVRNVNVVIYEPSTHIGGRLLTGRKFSSNNTTSFHVEMGDMSYISLKSNGLTNFVVDYLNLETEEVPTSMQEDVSNNNNLLHIRGKYMRMVDSANKAKDFYELNFHEKNYTPQALLYKAIEAIVPNAFSLNDTAWEKVIT